MEDLREELAQQVVLTAHVQRAVTAAADVGFSTPPGGASPSRRVLALASAGTSPICGGGALLEADTPVAEAEREEGEKGEKAETAEAATSPMTPAKEADPRHLKGVIRDLRERAETHAGEAE
eukprot:7281649-Pyramimonas_sp.AAC.1